MEETKKEVKLRDDLPATPATEHDRRSTIGDVSGITGESAETRGLGYAAAMDAGMHAARLRDHGIGALVSDDDVEAEERMRAENLTAKEIQSHHCGAKGTGSTGKTREQGRRRD